MIPAHDLAEAEFGADWVLSAPWPAVQRAVRGGG